MKGFRNFIGNPYLHLVFVVMIGYVIAYLVSILESEHWSFYANIGFLISIGLGCMFWVFNAVDKIDDIIKANKKKRKYEQQMRDRS